MVSRELRAQKGSRLQLADGFEQFLVEGKKIDLAGLGSSRKETIDEIKIRLPKKAEGLQILRSASPRNTLVKKESAESLNSFLFRDPVVLQQHIYDLGQDTFGDLDLLLTGPYLPEQRFRFFVEIRDVFQKVS